MTSVLLDTCAFAWSLQSRQNLTNVAVQAIETASVVFVSSISFYEITQKVRLGKWQEMQPFAADLLAHAYLSGVLVLDLDEAICHLAGLMTWVHRDPFDRPHRCNG